MTSDDIPTTGTFFKQEIEAILKRYPNMTVYEAIGALEAVKENLLDDLKELEKQGD